MEYSDYSNEQKVVHKELISKVSFEQFDSNEKIEKNSSEIFIKK